MKGLARISTPNSIPILLVIPVLSVQYGLIKILIVQYWRPPNIISIVLIFHTNSIAGKFFRVLSGLHLPGERPREGILALVFLYF